MTLGSDLVYCTNPNPPMADSQAFSTESVRDELLELRKRYMHTLNNSYSSRHHLDFPTKCIKDHLIPKELGLHKKVIVIGTDHKKLHQNIDTMLKGYTVGLRLG